MSHTEPVSELELDAYVDDQLSASRRIAVEAYLSGQPALAMRVMADLRTRDELRLALAETALPRRPSTTDAARRLQRGLRRGVIVGHVRRAATLVLLVGVGWIAHAEFGALSVGDVAASTKPPSYVAAAVMAHRTVLLRAEMASQPEVRTFDPQEIRAATAVVLPQLPEGWHVRDVQVFPSAYGPSVEMALQSPELGAASLFAVRPGGFNVVSPTVTTEGELSAAHWQVGDVAYALVAATGEGDDLDRAAVRLARTLH
jgi:anti-sigma factor RsiW